MDDPEFIEYNPAKNLEILDREIVREDMLYRDLFRDN